MKKISIHTCIEDQERICEAVRKLERNKKASEDFWYLVYNGHLKPEKTFNEFLHACVDENANVMYRD